MKGKKQITLMFFISLILFFLSFKLFLMIRYSVFTYDTAKVLGNLAGVTSFSQYSKNVGFIQGIVSQMYFLKTLIGHPPLYLIRGISYLFFMMTFFVLLYNRGKKESFLTVITLTASVYIFFHSNLVQYLGTYGMLIYCETILLSYFIIYYSDHYLSQVDDIKFQKFIPWFFLFFIATYIDIRYSFYLGVTYFIHLLRSFHSKKRAIKILVLGLITGLIVTIPIILQFKSTPWINSYEPLHIKVLLYSGEKTFRGILTFIIEKNWSLIESFVGTSLYLRLCFLSILCLGIMTYIKDNKKLNTVLIFFTCLLVLMLASIFRIHPYGRFRYCLGLVVFFVSFYLEGVNVLLNILKRKKRLNLALCSSFLLAISFYHYGYLKDSFRSVKKSYISEMRSLERLNTISSSSHIFCDIISQKRVNAVNKKCTLITNWSIHSDNHPLPIKKVESLLRQYSKFSVFLYKSKDSSNMVYLEDLIERKIGAKLIKQTSGANYLYEYQLNKKEIIN